MKQKMMRHLPECKMICMIAIVMLGFFADKANAQSVNDSSVAVADTTKPLIGRFWEYGPDEIPCRFSNYYELNYGLGLSEFNHYVGFTYTHMVNKLGFHASAYYGFGVGSLSLMGGPTYTFHINGTGSNWQAYMGLGMNFLPKISFATQAGVRYNLDAGSLSRTETMSLSAGLMYVDGQVVPSLGLNVMPAVLQIGEWWDDKEYSYPHHYSEFLVGYGVDQLLMGVNYSYMPSRIGGYMSALIGVDLDYSINVGPSLRLTDGSAGVDIMAFQGIGVFSGGLGGETGFRFGFGDDMKYGKWSLSAAMGYSAQGIYGTLGMSWPIAAYVGIAAGVVMYAVALVMGGGDATQAADLFPTSWSESSGGYTPPATSFTVSSSSSSSSSGSSSVDCYSTYQVHYDKMANNVKSLIESFVRTGSGYIQSSDPYTVHVKQCGGNTTSGCVSMSALNGERNTLRRAQKDMSDLRARARKAGCNIERSPWEGARIDVY